MNRTLFRGVTAGLISGVVVAIGAIAGTALAAAPPKSTDATPYVAEPTPPTMASVLYAERRAAALRAAHKARLARLAEQRRRAAASRRERRLALTGSPQGIAHALVLRHGWSESQWGCLDQLWTRESNWRVSAQNSSGAYGIPQALPAYKMSMMGSDWRTNPITQIRWGIWYIADMYGSPCTALSHSYNYNYY